MPRPTPRRTKIVCTLGPAVASREGVRALIGAGMDVARLNFSHGTHDDHRRMMGIVREEARSAGRVVPILQDLQGPKIRLGIVEDGAEIHIGDTVVLTSEPIEVGTADRVHVSYDALAEEVSEGNRILLDDGNLELVVKRVNGHDVTTEVIVGGPLRSRKGVNLPELKSARPSLTDKDIEDLAFGLENDVDLIALSFVRSGADVDDLTRRIRAAGKTTPVISKIEKPEAVHDFDAILEASGGIMVARGDLGIEIPMQNVPIVQKQLIRACLEASKPVITATQMLESMMENPRPTRAEATDVANAVFDGSDAVMLSGETAAGKYPIEAVRVMDEIVRQAEANRRGLGGRQALAAVGDSEQPVTDAVSYTAVRLADETQADAVACLTHSGSTARSIASHRPDVPIYAFTDDESALGRMALTWGVEPIAIAFQEHTDDGVRSVHRELLSRGYHDKGDRVVITAGLPLPSMGRTNMIHVTTLGEDWV
ncbi:pyruvate kinase [Rubrivirga sp.]|uniref:pyruvate kinase n=1 Tax=Rubrivirga sp. TaxID=1885344 RepID=UPI003C78B7FD